MAFFELLLLSAFVILTRSQTEENTKLLLVQAVFRHSDRSPVYLFPNDPNDPKTSWPMGLGKLTQIGKKQHYALGKYLRSMYKDFITTDPSEVYANSSAEDRCLNSVESNLASFYAPEGKWRFEDDLDWQPIPIHYTNADWDRYLNWDMLCPRAQLEDVISLNTREMHELYEKHKTLVKDVSKYAGIDYADGQTPLFLFDTLEVERLHKLIIPEWVDTYWEGMNEISLAVFRTFFSSRLQLRLRIGPFMGVVSNNLMGKINGDIPNLKVVMNSVHDVNVAGILLALNFTDMPRPPYGATLLIELHEMPDASMAVRLLYLNSTNVLKDIGGPHLLVMNDCSEFCPVEKFIESYQSLIPDNWLDECQLTFL